MVGGSFLNLGEGGGVQRAELGAQVFLSSLFFITFLLFQLLYEVLGLGLGFGSRHMIPVTAHVTLFWGGKRGLGEEGACLWNEVWS